MQYIYKDIGELKMYSSIEKFRPNVLQVLTDRKQYYGTPNDMVLIFDGNLEIGAQARSNLCQSICLRPSIRSRAVTNRIFFIFMFFQVLNYHEIYAP